jgi:Sec-independent protein translocase protein TatA
MVTHENRKPLWHCEGGTSRGRWISEFKASLSFRTVRATQRNPVSKNQNKQTKQTNKTNKQTNKQKKPIGKFQE